MKTLDQSGVIIIGAGPAGLAVAACLKQRGVPFVVLEQTDQIASSWQRHYDRLHLHTDKDHSGLPFMPFPPDAPRYPPRKMVVDYMQAYARHFGIRPIFNQKVTSARRVAEGAARAWEVRTQDTLYRAPALVVATGVNHEPLRPTWPGQAGYRGCILHSAEYKNGAPFKGQRVLVVGLGNSGGEIAIDLFEHGAQPSIAVRSPVNVIPREVFGVPFLTVGIMQRKLPAWLADALNAPTTRAVVGDLTRYGLRKPKHGPVTQIRKFGRVPFIDVGTIKLIKSGQVQVRPGINRFTEDGVIFTDGRQERFDALVLATGYQPRIDAWLQTDLGTLRDGKPLSSGQDTGVPGLYYCGYYISPTGMLREIGIEAQRLAGAIAKSLPLPGDQERSAARKVA